MRQPLRSAVVFGGDDDLLAGDEAAEGGVVRVRCLQGLERHVVLLDELQRDVTGDDRVRTRLTVAPGIGDGLAGLAAGDRAGFLTTGRIGCSSGLGRGDGSTSRRVIMFGKWRTLRRKIKSANYFIKLRYGSSFWDFSRRFSLNRFTCTRNLNTARF